jgi:integrase
MRVKLTDAVVKSLSLGSASDAFYWDTELRGFGLRLRRLIDGTSQRTWTVQYRVGGGRSRRAYIGQPGSAEVLSTKQARDKAKLLLGKVALGDDPQAEDRRAKDRHRFDAVVAEYLAERAGELRPRSLAASSAYLTGPAYFRPLFAQPLDQIKRGDVSSCITSIKRNSGPVSAARARSALQAFFRWAMEMGHAEQNPVIGALAVKVNAPRERVLSDAELAAIWNAAGDDDFGRVVRLLILTAARRNEIGGMAWSELDRERGTWTLPASRSKNKREHTLPLPEAAWQIVDAVPQIAGRDQLFGSRSKSGMNGWNEVKRALDARLGDGVAPWMLHDLRRTTATRLADLGVQPHVIEAILNHHSGHRSGVAGIYNRSSYQREVTAALALWADHVRALVEGGKRKIVALAAS